jgi:hypothetical protein
MRLRTSLAIALLALAACGDGLPLAPQFVLRAAQELWQRSGIDSYELTVQRICYCLSAEPVRVRVENGIVVSRTFASTGDPVPSTYANLYPDVPGLFAIVEEAARDADDLDVRFDATYGFPAEISIDWYEVAVDDEISYRTESFTITP